MMDPRVKAVIYPRPHQPTRNIASEKQRLARDLTEPFILSALQPLSQTESCPEGTSENVGVVFG